MRQKTADQTVDRLFRREQAVVHFYESKTGDQNSRSKQSISFFCSARTTSCLCFPCVKKAVDQRKSAIKKSGHTIWVTNDRRPGQR